jgi:hypothetical protein
VRHFKVNEGDTNEFYEDFEKLVKVQEVVPNLAAQGNGNLGN